MTPEAPKGRPGQKVQFTVEEGGKISNLSERKEAHLQDLPWQQLRRSWIQQQYRYTTVSRTMFAGILDNIKAIVHTECSL